METSPQFLSELMDIALEQAQLAFNMGEVPIGAVISSGDELIAKAHNLIEKNSDATAHAEMLAIQQASKSKKNWRLNDAILCVNVEPCTMCAGAIRLARIPLIVYGTKDERLGAFGTLYDISQDTRLGSIPRVISGIKEDKCKKLMQEFFKTVRDA